MCCVIVATINAARTGTSSPHGEIPIRIDPTMNDKMISFLIESIAINLAWIVPRFCGFEA